MVGNAATRLACEFQKTQDAVMKPNVKPQGGAKHRCLVVSRGLLGCSATGQTVKPLKKWRRESEGLDVGKIFLPFRRGKVFLT
jgi:hypothetical protein